MRKAMMLRTMQGILLGALVIGLFLVMQGIASAGLMGVRLMSGPATVTCLDGETCDSNAAVGAVTFNGTVGIFTINVTTGVSYPVLGTPEVPWIDMNSVNITANGPGELEVLASQTDYTGVWQGARFSGGGTQSNVTSFHQVYLSNTNAQFALTTLIDGHPPHPPGPFSFDSNPSNPGSGSLYSLTLRAVITAGPGTAATSFDHEFKVVPEPASALLFAPALALAGLMRSRRHAQIIAS